MLYLKGLSIEGFRSIRDKQEIDINALGRATRIAGVNNDTGGDSGAGKTSVAEAIDYLFNVSSIPATVLKCRESTGPIEICGTFLNEKSEEIVIKRNSKDGVSVSINNELVEGLSTIVEEKIDELISIPRKIFRKMYHKKQKESGFFLKLTPKESWNFLNQACGLGEWQIKLEKLDIRVKELKDLLSKKEYEISVDKDSLKDLEERTNFVVPEKPVLIDTKHIEKEIKQIESTVEKLIAEKDETISKIQKPENVPTDYGRLIEKLEEEIGKHENRHQDVLDEVNAKYKKLKTIVEFKEKELNDKRFAESNANHLKKDIKKKVTELKMLGEEECPTCNQVWVDPIKQEIINEKKTALKSDKATYDKLVKESDGQEDLVEKIAKGKAKLEELSEPVVNNELEHINKYKAEIKKYQEKISKASSEYQTAYSAYSTEIDKAKNHFNELIESQKSKASSLASQVQENELKKEYYDKAVEKIESDKAIFENAKQTRRDKIFAKEKELSELNKEMDLAYESKKAIRSYNMKVFQETLDTIAYNASNILNMVPNAQNSTITFESFKELKNGNIKEEITAFINNGKGQNVDVRSFSGGEETSIDLAVDLAVIDVLEDKFNKGINIFLMDEPFNGLDGISKEGYVEILTNIDTNKKLIIMDHSVEVKEMISDTIIVEKSNDVSRIVNE